MSQNLILAQMKKKLIAVHSECFSFLDEIVLNYVAGIADDISLLDADGIEEDDSFDVEEFMEMMDAYLPGFAQIPG